jgi:hypothetical protein
MSHRLRTAMLRAQLDAVGLAAAVAVDVKTVNRWLSGRMPHQRTRLAVAELLGENEADYGPAPGRTSLPVPSPPRRSSAPTPTAQTSPSSYGPPS